MLLIVAPAWASHSALPIRIGLPHSLFYMQYELYFEWQQYLETKLHHQVQFVIQRKYNDSTMQLHVEKLDFAWITDYPDVHIKSGVSVVAVPLSKGRPYYASYLIVPATDTKTTSLMQLKGAVFALADPRPNGSYLEIQFALVMAGVDPTSFFSKIFFTGSHREVIDAVALGLANAGEVDSIVWASLAKNRPDLTAQIRIVTKSPEYGAPPIVANRFVNKEHYIELQRVLLGMAQDPKGIELLKRMNIDGFVAGDEKIYERTSKMMHILSPQ